MFQLSGEKCRCNIRNIGFSLDYSFAKICTRMVGFFRTWVNGRFFAKYRGYIIVISIFFLRYVTNATPAILFGCILFILPAEPLCQTSESTNLLIFL